MDNFLNFLYCFDKNYNKQAFSSMISILDNISEKINFYVIHNEEFNIENIPNSIKNHKNLNQITFFMFKDYDYYFPNIKDVHISLATYFRLFIRNYLPNNLENIIFLDPDIICIKDPIPVLKDNIKKLNESNYIISAKTEHTRGEKRIHVNDKYFNAGFMIINYKKWIENDIQSKLIDKLKFLKDKIYQWDQDVLNSFFNGDYNEVEKWLNFNANLFDNEKGKENIYFLHYLGSHKPWLTSGMFQNSAYHYHKNFRKIDDAEYHIIHKWKTQSAIDFLIALFTLKVFKIDTPIRFLTQFLYSFVKQ